MTEAEPSLTDSFELHRGPLLGLAYRMLGSRAEAEDAVQEAWLRWRETDRSRVQQPRAFLTQTVTRLCLDRLKSAQAQREVYVGPWLPEPILEDESLLQPGPEAASEFASDLSNAFMLALERLSPLERAAFLLHDIFDTDFAEVARALGRSEAACRQLAARARSRVREARPRYQNSPRAKPASGRGFPGCDAERRHGGTHASAGGGCLADLRWRRARAHHRHPGARPRPRGQGAFGPRAQASAATRHAHPTRMDQRPGRLPDHGR